MPEKETILSQTAALKILDITSDQTDIPYLDDEIWEGAQESAYFKIIKKKTLIPGNQNTNTIYALSVSGQKNDVKKVIKDFIDVFGVPVISTIMPGDIHIVRWGANNVDKKRNT